MSVELTLGPVSSAAVAPHGKLVALALVLWELARLEHER